MFRHVQLEEDEALGHDADGLRAHGSAERVTKFWVLPLAQRVGRGRRGHWTGSGRVPDEPPDERDELPPHPPRPPRGEYYCRVVGAYWSGLKLSLKMRDGNYNCNAVMVRPETVSIRTDLPNQGAGFRTSPDD